MDLEDSFEDVEERFGDRICAYHRVDLHRGLRELAEAAGVKIRLGCEVVDMDTEQGEFEIRGGERVKSDFVVLADGCHVSLSHLSSHLFILFSCIFLMRSYERNLSTN